MGPSLFCCCPHRCAVLVVIIDGLILPDTVKFYMVGKSIVVP